MNKKTRRKLQAFLEAHPDIDTFEIIAPDLAGGLRGKWIGRDKIRKAFNEGIKMPLSTPALDVWGRDVEGWVLEQGDGDGICRADIRTLVPTPWLQRPTAQVMMSMHEPGGRPCAYDPRLMVTELQQRFAALGLTPVLASEMEFHLLRNEDDALGRPLHTQSDRLGGGLQRGQTYGIEVMQDMAPLLHTIRDACNSQQLPIDTLIKEAAPSQYEINLLHQPDALLAADQAVMLQRAIRGVARQHELRATFMAKPFGDLAGNGMHLHISLLDKAGHNVLADADGMLRHAVAGCLDSLADVMLLLAPNLNSYRRFVRDCHAPLAPTWGFENRTTAIRIPTDTAENTRLEHRVAGADAQPHLAIAAILAGMLHGIENTLTAPDAVTGNAYEQFPPSLPRYWRDAHSRFTDSDFIARYFGAEFQRVYSALKLQEMDEFDRCVTPLEYEVNL
jgi:glutamine synthetase